MLSPRAKDPCSPPRKAKPNVSSWKFQSACTSLEVSPFHNSPRPSPAKRGKHRFVNPYGKGDICAAGLLPYFYQEGTFQAILQVENKDGVRTIAAFGGKVEACDTHWCETALRELREETAELLSPMALAHIQAFCSTSDAANAMYVGDSKFEMLFYELDDAVLMEWRQMMKAYCDKFHGETMPGRRGEHFLELSVEDLVRGKGRCVVDGKGLRLKPELKIAVQQLHSTLQHRAGGQQEMCVTDGEDEEGTQQLTIQKAETDVGAKAESVDESKRSGTPTPASYRLQGLWLTCKCALYMLV